MPEALLAPPEATLPNSFAYLALFAWPVVCLILFVRLPTEKAAIWSMLGGYLLLPTAMSLDIPYLPPLDKNSIPSLTTFLFCWMKGPSSPKPRGSIMIYVVVLLMIISPVMTSLTNSYELQIGNRSLPGFYPMDGLKFALRNLILVAPFFVGLRFLSSDAARLSLLKSLPVAAVFYSLPMLLEIRLSPQLHRWVYGFFPHDFSQQYRDGGFRPVVFLGHGLAVALFVSMALIAAAVLVRAKARVLNFSAGSVASYLGVMLVLCKTMGAAVYAIVAVPMALFTTPKTWVRMATVMILVVAGYPLLREHNIIPIHHIVDIASRVSSDRATSFQVRVTNEDMLLSKADERPLLGWGTWGRSLIFDPTSGKDISVTDGEWIIQFGMFGWLGYLWLFGLFVIAVMRARVGVRGPVTPSSVVLGGVTLILAVNVIDLLPNAELLPFTFLMAGSVAGCLHAEQSGSAKAVKAGRSMTRINPAQTRNRSPETAEL